MKQYEAINWYEKEPNEVYDYLDKLEEEEQYPFFSWLMQHFPDLEIDWLEIFEDFKDALFQHERVDEVLSFVAWYQQKDPSNYSKRYEFIEKGLCNYFFYKKDLKSLQERIALIQQNPVPAIDTLTIRLLYQLIFHGHYDLAVSYAEAVWKPIDESDQLIGFAAHPFVNTIYVSQLQHFYEAYLNGINLDENKLFNQLVSLGFELDNANFNKVILALREDLSKETIEDSIQNGNDDYLEILNIHFLKYMLHTYQLPFVFSEWMWNFISSTKIFGKQKEVENWFYIDAKMMDKHILNRLDTFLGSNELEIFGKVWGLDFVFDFLHKQQLLAPDLCEKMMENIAYFRNEMIRIANESLWQMTFVFDWPRVNSYEVDPSEKYMFTKTYGKSNSEAIEMVDRYFSTFPIPLRVKKELKINDSKDIKPISMWSKSKPIIKEEPKVGRNDSCPCGSGKKFKKCCMD